MIMYGTIGIIAIGSVLVEKHCRNGGNTEGALAARRFGRFFVLGAGAWIAFEWVRGMLILLAL